jgi:Domain of unknown function (DUF4419)
MERLPRISVRAALERTACSRIVICRNAEQEVVEGGDFHPLIAAAAIAYKQHMPLVLSPDMIWITILQGVARHIALHAESLRPKLVAHQTRIELLVNTNLGRLPETDAQMLAVTQSFVELIGKHVPADKQFLLRGEFSTTTDVERIVGSIVVMDSFQPYFDYVFRVICGIPSVILEGTPADWESLGAKVQLLHESDLDISWWTRHLLPLCDHFVRTADGDADRTHWNNLCKITERYGVDDLNGWLLKFIPYIRHDKNELPCHRNPVLELSEFPTDNKKMGKITGCTSNMLPTGLSFAPVACQNLEADTTDQYQFVAGLVGVRQSNDDFSLRPVFGWAISEAAQIDALIARLRNEHEVHPPERIESAWLLASQIFNGNLPGDLWRFYAETGGATLKAEGAKGPHIFCRIKPVSQIKPAINQASVQSELTQLLKQGLLNLHEERQTFARDYSRLRVFAESHEDERDVFYVFGIDPEIFGGEVLRASRGQIFRWDGGSTRESFEPVGHSFSEWLERMLSRTAKAASL